MSVVCLIDMKNVAFRAGYGMGTFYGPDGSPCGVLAGVPLMLLDLMAHVGEALYFGIWDGCPPHQGIPERLNWRKLHARMLRYKENRTPSPEAAAIRKQLPDLARFLDLVRIPQFGVAGVEADDLIGILSKFFHKRGDTVFFYSNDSDLFQLVDNSGVFAVVPLTGGDGMVTFDEAKVQEKMGVAPRQVAHFKALVGDDSDGFKPIPMVGKVKALRFLAEGLNPASADGESQVVYQRYPVLHGYWPAIQEAFLLARIPRTVTYRYIPEIYQEEIRAVMREAVRVRPLRIRISDLDKRLKAVISFCSRYGLSGALVRRREFFQFARIED